MLFFHSGSGILEAAGLEFRRYPGRIGVDEEKKQLSV
jgi:hypothetical protein